MLWRGISCYQFTLSILKVTCCLPLSQLCEWVFPCILFWIHPLLAHLIRYFVTLIPFCGLHPFRPESSWCVVVCVSGVMNSMLPSLLCCIHIASMYTVPISQSPCFPPWRTGTSHWPPNPAMALHLTTSNTKCSSSTLARAVVTPAKSDWRAEQRPYSD